MTRLRAILILFGTAVLMTGCGSTTTAPFVPTPTPQPAAVITAVANGAIIVHPSSLSGWCCAFELPIQIKETGGGTAVWQSAKITLRRNGGVIETNELGSNEIAADGFSTIGANSTNTYAVIFHLNNTNFESADVTLSFGDKKDNRQFVVQVPFGSSSGVGSSPVAKSFPGRGMLLGR